MNREIKCRGFYHHKKNALYPEIKKWVYGYLIIEDGVAFIKDGVISYRVDPESVGQYTGLKDKNGQEIYEGDVISTSFGQLSIIEYGYWEGGCNPNTGFHIKLIRMDKNSTLFYDESGDIKSLGRHSISQTPPPYSDSPLYEVIGNIYQNPELLDK